MAIEITNIAIKGPKGDQGDPGLLVNKKKYNKLPGFVIVGDSIAGFGNRSTAITSLTAVGNRATAVVGAANMLVMGAEIHVGGASQPEYNNVFKIDEVVDSYTAKFNLYNTPSASPASPLHNFIYAVLLQRPTINCWSTVSNYLAAHKGLYLGNFAIPGSWSAELNSQLDMALDGTKNSWNRSPDIVFVCSGINDTRNSVAASTTIANLESAINRIKNTGATPVILTTLPVNNTTSGWSITSVSAAREINNWIKNNVSDLGGIVIDANAICIDLANQYGNYKADYTIDGLHPTPQASFQIAKKIKTDLWDLITSVDDRTLIPIGTNQDLSGTAGTLSGAGASGVVADGCTIVSTGGGLQTVVGAKGLAMSGNGESQRMTISAAANGDYGRFRNTDSVHGSVSVGDKVICRARIRTESDLSQVKSVTLKSTIIIGGVTLSDYALAIEPDGNTNNIFGYEKFDLTLETTPFQMTVDTSLILFSADIAFKNAGIATADISDFGIYKIS